MKTLFSFAIFLGALPSMAQEMSGIKLEASHANVISEELKIYEKFHEDSKGGQRCPDNLDFDFIKLLKKYSGALGYQLPHEKKGIILLADSQEELNRIHTKLPISKYLLKKGGASKVKEDYQPFIDLRLCTYKFPKTWGREGSLLLKIKFHKLP